MISDFQDISDNPAVQDVRDNSDSSKVSEVQKPELAHQGAYHKVSLLVDRQLKLHMGETFDLDMICRWLSITERDNRNAVAEKLNYEVKKGNLEKNNRLYKPIDSSIKEIPWNDVTERDAVPFHWPRGQDGTHFPFDGHLTVRPKDLIVIAGVSNMGKSGLCKNLVWENMDDWNGKLTYMVNEYQPVRFKIGTQLMCWNTAFNEDGTAKFKMIERLSDWQYAIQPNHLNIIDWVSMDGDFYRIGAVLDEIRNKLKDGIAVIVIQKGEGKDLGTGGQFSEHFASYYLSVDFGRIFFKKAKEYGSFNPNGKMFGFDLMSGVLLSNIKEIHRCGQCAGKGTRWDRQVQENVNCIGCSGKGWL